MGANNSSSESGDADQCVDVKSYFAGWSCCGPRNNNPTVSSSAANNEVSGEIDFGKGRAPVVRETTTLQDMPEEPQEEVPKNLPFSEIDCTEFCEAIKSCVEYDKDDDQERKHTYHVISYKNFKAASENLPGFSEAHFLR